MVSYKECVGLPQKSIIRDGFSLGEVDAIAPKFFEKSPIDAYEAFVSTVRKKRKIIVNQNSVNSKFGFLNSALWK